MQNQWKRWVTYCCGSYKRYGAGICSPHTIAQQTLERAVLEEVNQLLAGCGELNQLAEEVIREQTRQRDVTPRNGKACVTALPSGNGEKNSATRTIAMAFSAGRTFSPIRRSMRGRLPGCKDN